MELISKKESNIEHGIFFLKSMETFVNQKINENLNIFIKKSEEDSAGSSESSMDVD